MDCETPDYARCNLDSNSTGIITNNVIHLFKCNLLNVKWLRSRFGIFKKMPKLYKSVLISWMNVGGGNRIEVNHIHSPRKDNKLYGAISVL